MVKQMKTSQCNYKKELKIGARIELEHTHSMKRARSIASDHLKEFKCYYSRGLVPMERRLKRMSK
jgi:hypothetical protein